MQTRFTQQRAAAFRRVAWYLRDQGGCTLLVTQIDPDAIGCVAVMDAVLEHLRVGDRLWVYGRMSHHPQSQGLLELEGIAGRFRQVEPADLRRPLVLLDSSAGHDMRVPFSTELTPTVIVDHHPGATESRETATSFWWIERSGAAVTLCLELARGVGLPLRGLGQSAATAAALGIYTDTDGLATTRTLGYDATQYARLLPFADREELQRLANAPLPPGFDPALLAEGSVRRVGRRIAIPARRMTLQEGELLGTLASLGARMHGVRLALAWGVVGDTLRVSARTLRREVKILPVLEGLLGPNCGARDCVGGGSIALPQGTPDRETVEEWTGRVDAALGRPSDDTF